jgi:3-oxoacyl-[acyl-carrier-protein] synthase-3
MYSQIAGTGAYLPEKVLTNHDLERMMDTSDAWIRERTGIIRRHIVADHQGTVDLAEPAARAAITAAGLEPRDIDLIVFATSTPDFIFPNGGVLLQQRLGCPGGAAFSVEAACSGFVYALSVADKFVKAGEARHALVVGAETMSRITDWSDRGTAVLFADGAGAFVLKAAAEPGILSTHLHADGSYKDLLYCGGGPARRADPGTIHMAGSEVFKIAVINLGKAVEEALAANGLDRSAVDWLVPHQANIRIIEGMGRKLGLAPERVVITVDRHANTSAASIPLALAEAMGDGRIKRGQLVLMEALGGGLVWGSALVRI